MYTVFEVHAVEDNGWWKISIPAIPSLADADANPLAQQVSDIEWTAQEMIFAVTDFNEDEIEVEVILDNEDYWATDDRSELVDSNEAEPLPAILEENLGWSVANSSEDVEEPEENEEDL